MAVQTPETLVKFCSCETATTILSSQTLRWSAPHLFNDPFELSHRTSLSFEPAEMLQSAIKVAAAMIFAKESPRGNSPLSNAVRRWRDEERFASPEEAEGVLGELLSQMIDQRQKSLERVMTDWRKFTRNLRICSFTAKPDNLSAWQRFADNHSGIAIRFQCGEFTALPSPREVAYRNIRPEITTLKEQLGVIINSEIFDAQDHFFDKFITKPTFDNGEQEWRCFQLAEDDLTEGGKDSANWFSDLKFERNEITAVYFGINTANEVKKDIVEIIRSKYNQAKLFQCKPAQNSYLIEFDRLPLK